MAWDQYLCVAEETVWGTEVPRTEFHRTFEDSVVTPGLSWRTLNVLGERDPEIRFKELESGAVSISIPAVYDGMGTLLRNAIGEVSTTGAGPYVHTFAIDDNSYTRSTAKLIGVSAELNYALPDATNKAQLLTGGRVATWGMSFTQNEEVKFTCELQGQKTSLEAVTAAGTFPDYGHATTSPMILPSQAVLTIDGGAAAVDSFEFTVNNALRTDRGLSGSAYVSEARAQGYREISGTIEMRMLDNTIFAKWLSGSSAALILTCTGAATNDEMIINFPFVYFTGDPLALEHGEDQAVTLNWTAHKSGATEAMNIVLTNDASTAI